MTDDHATVATAASVEALWRELVTAALLGTDRREPPVAMTTDIADVVDDAVRPDAASRMLAVVGAVTAARRAAFLPLPPAAPVQPPPVDDRPLTPSASSATWHQIVAEWPVLEDEWVLAVIAHGYRLAPDVLVQALLRHRNDAVRRARVALAGGPRSAWLIEHVPELAARGSRTAPAEAVASLPELAITPDLAELLPLDAHTFVRRLVPGVRDAVYGPSHRSVLVHLLARCRPEVLVDTAEALAATATGLGVALADLCRLRHRMLDELGGGRRSPRQAAAGSP
jgi:hypothetical protein